MTDPADGRPPSAAPSSDAHTPAPPLPPPNDVAAAAGAGSRRSSGSTSSTSARPAFEPIFTLVTDSSSRTIHHPHVHYIFNDDDPDILLRALAEQPRGSADHPLGSSDPASDAAPANRAVLLDLEHGPGGSFNVASASSLSPSWAVLDTSLTEIPAPADETGAGTAAATARKRPGRLMLRVQGVESGGLGTAPEADLNLSDAGSSRHGGSSSGVQQRAQQQQQQGKGDAAATTEAYAPLADEFDKKMSVLRSVVDASEERRRKTATADSAAAASSGQVQDEHRGEDRETSPEVPALAVEAEGRAE